MKIKIFIDTVKKQGEILLNETWKTSLILFKIIIPVSVATKLMTDWGIVDYAGMALGHVMGLAGLPGSMGVVWATAMILNLYTAIIVFFSMPVSGHLTIAQVTTLSTMMLVAHALPVELGIARKAGIRLWFMLVFRVAGAFASGIMLYHLYRMGGFLQTEFTAVWKPDMVDLSWGMWALSQLKTLISIYIIILFLLITVRLLSWLHITDMLGRLLRPLLFMMGIGKDAVPVTIIGMTMGIGYGGGMIIREAHSGRLSQREIFFSLSFMGLMHSMIEDTLLMIFLGGHVTGVLLFRFVFAMLIIFIMVKLMRRLSDERFYRYFFRTQRDVVKYSD
ncbi:MAG: hypothetical protein GX846_07490 [Deltaproteobacteria bacterium]|nr:hypothetical protein [Deltaproteobacteria bacterium]